MKLTKSLVILFSVSSALVQARADDIVIRSGPDRVSLIELYTSEGCSSCPPAEKWLSGLRNDPRLWRALVPVAFHVDYWDRLGWKDRFARAEFTARQRAYAVTGAVSTVYTPGFMIDGREWSGWFEDHSLPIKKDSAGNLEGRVGPNGDVTVTFVSDSKLEDGIAHVAWLGFDLVSDVRRGENAGRALHHDFAVLEHTSKRLSRESGGSWSAQINAPKMTDQPAALAVWIEVNGRPIQAAGGWLGKH